MNAEPRVLERAEQPYVGVSAAVTMENIGEVLPALHPEVYGWLEERGVAPAGPPFWKYNLIDMLAYMEVEIGAPVADPISGEGHVAGGVLPGGRYAVLRHTGHPSELADATADLLAWAENQGLQFEMERTDRGELWRSRLEIYHSDPDAEPDMSKWITDLAFLLRD